MTTEGFIVEVSLIQRYLFTEEDSDAVSSMFHSDFIDQHDFKYFMSL